MRYWFKSRFISLYTCTTWIRERLLNLAIRYNSWCLSLERHEKIIVGAAVALILYTATLTAIGPIVSAALTNRTISNSGSVKAIGVGIYWDQACTNPVASISWGFWTLVKVLTEQFTFEMRETP